MRELHWHPNNDEWQYYISGQGRMTVFAASGKARTFDYQAGDVGYIPFAMGHYVEIQVKKHCASWKFSAAPTLPTSLSINGWL